MSYFKPYNPNPCGCRVGDCTVRAICKATGLPWEQAYCALAAYGLEAKDLPSASICEIIEIQKNTCIFQFIVL